MGAFPHLSEARRHAGLWRPTAVGQIDGLPPRPALELDHLSPALELRGSGGAAEPKWGRGPKNFRQAVALLFLAPELI